MAKMSLISKKNPVLENYHANRQRFLGASEGTGSSLPPLTDRHGFYLQRHNYLTERIAGVDKLFHTLVMGIVEDPDYAVQKDPKIYERMMRDPQIYYCLMVRRAAVSSLPWVVRPRMELTQDKMAKRIAAAAEHRIRQIPRFSELVDNIMDAILPGMSVNELVWKVGPKGEYVVQNHFPVNKDRVKFDRDGRIYLLSPRAPTTGSLVPPYKFVRHTFNTTDGSWKKPADIGYSYYGKGLADTPLYHYFHFKMMALKYLLKEMERYGIPFKLLYTGPQNAELAEKMSEIMLALKNDSVVNIPGKKGEVNVDIQKVATSKNLFILFINYIDTLITKAVLGQELMTEMPAVGSYAAAAIHKSVFGLINARDRTQVKDTLDRSLLAYDAQLNTPNLAPEYIPVFDFKKSAVEETSEFLTTVLLAMKLGLTVSEAQVREYTGLREPAEGEKLLILPKGEVTEEEAPRDQNAQAQKP